MSKQMKAAVFDGIQSISVQDYPMPTVGDQDVLIRTGASVICGTDIRIFRGQKTKGVRVPSIIGHELAGEIVTTGSAVRDLKPGDRITVAPVIACGTCRLCRKGNSNICENRTAIGYEYDGAFAEYVLIPGSALYAGNVFLIPDGLSYTEAALAEPISCCVNGQENMGDIQSGENVLIVGFGPIGAMHLLLAKAIPDSRVIVSEISEERRTAASRLGADAVVDPSESDLVESVLNFTDGVGVDKAILAFGAPTIVNDVLRATAKGGGVNFFAGFPKDSETRIDPNLVHYNQLQITGASASTVAQFKRSLDGIADGSIPGRDLITSSYPLEQINAAFADASSPTGLKVAIHYD